MVDYTRDADNKTLASLIHTSTSLPFESCLKETKKMPKNKKKELIQTCFKYAEFYDRPPREFEYADLTFNLIVSAACFGQLKRHRIATITSQTYNPNLGVTIPESIKKCGMGKGFNDIVSVTNKVYKKITEHNPLAAQYVLTNAHRKRVLFKINARELYHISRLREDTHAQWDIQNITAQMTALARKIIPLTMLFIGGKDRYPEIYEANFGEKPKVMPLY